jgi:hypothetical protein
VSEAENRSIVAFAFASKQKTLEHEYASLVLETVSTWMVVNREMNQ